ncbi:cellulase family glycosylhydrolase [Cohnella luojiensis]|uniref:Glycoside hydrolase family 5 protein n=1 Tax=Cohnella luojiensis TaxID=652876 RepID=A0A4Y8LN61_9BACL|nr:cellulase family glycosylhydrolase [Cohnella luojiensis]TFE19512.1 glycoside hydrolase family 5 protein [Cohnella luojiensis]
MTELKTNEVIGFLKAAGRKLVNGEGREIVLRGVGFGSWLLPEGYMWCFPERGDRPRRIERMVEDLIGSEKAAKFWELYYDRYISEPDIERIAAEGFNSVRVPVNSRFLLEEGESVRYKERHLLLLDRVIGWCRKHRLYVILDLHGAPGGQTGTNIDDSANDLPELFTDERNMQFTIELWAMLAKRYKDEWIVAGYDLLNEPLPNWFSEYNDRIMPLYKEIIKAIRKEDDRHMIILEGAHWSTDWSIFGEKLDDNVMLQFHKYWNNPDTESIQHYLDKREQWEVPIFMGEGGENNKEWYAGAFRLFEDHDISWNFWTWKKMDKDNSPCQVHSPMGWDLLIGYLEGGEKPDAATAERVLWKYLDNLSFANNAYHPEVVNSLLRRPPVRIPAIFYGFRGENVSYGVSEKSGNPIGFRERDGTDIRFIESDRAIPNFQHGRGEPWLPDEKLCVQLSAGDWLAYEFVTSNHNDDSLYRISLRMLAPHGEGRIEVRLDDVSYGYAAWSGSSWEEVWLQESVRLDEGNHRVVLLSASEARHPVRIEWLEIMPWTT